MEQDVPCLILIYIIQAMKLSVISGACNFIFEVILYIEMWLKEECVLVALWCIEPGRLDLPLKSLGRMKLHSPGDCPPQLVGCPEHFNQRLLNTWFVFLFKQWSMMVYSQILQKVKVLNKFPNSMHSPPCPYYIVATLMTIYLKILILWNQD